MFLLVPVTCPLFMRFLGGQQQRQEMKFGTMKLFFLALVIRCKHLPVLCPPLLTGELSCSYMRPGTPHYVVTVEDAIVYGNHFFATSTSQPTAFGVIHCFIMGY